MQIQNTADLTLLDVDSEGYLTDATQWTPDVAREIARDAGITLTDNPSKTCNCHDKWKSGTQKTTVGARVVPNAAHI